MTNKKKIAEQVKYRLAAGWPDIDDSTLFQDLYVAIEQKVNAKFKVQHFSEIMPNGAVAPDNLALATYPNVAVTSLTNGRSMSTLPTIPISLPRNMGVFDIQDNVGMASFIPLLATQRILLKSQKLINELMGQVGYEVRGKVVEYTKDITMLGISSVTMLLVVLDMSQYAITDFLPIPASMEEEIVNELYTQFAPVQAQADAKKDDKK